MKITEEIDLDQLGITVCAIHGTHFGSYARFLNALEIRWAVVTDGDPKDDGTLRGETRADRLLARLGLEENHEDSGVFVGETTFEFDLFQADEDNADACIEAFTELAPSAATRDRIDQWGNERPELAEFVHVLKRIGKGRAAQRLAQSHLEAPAYVADALRYLADA